jgi:2-keto-3-deoxy-L-rhamnonate aldolase RhmA
VNDFIQNFREGNLLFGTLVTATSAKWVQIIESLKLDCVFVDLEHFPIGWQELSWLCQTYQALNIPTIIRIPSPDPFEACRVLDVGATGVVAAYIETVEQVQQLRGAVKLRPIKGEYLRRILSENLQIDKNLAEYIKQYNANRMLLINIESIPAVNNLDEILSVPDLDGILIGPHDLSCSLQIPEQYDHPLFEKTVINIIEKTKKNKLGIGIHNLPKIEQEIKYLKAGINLVFRLSDLSHFKISLYNDLQKIRASMGEKELEGEPKHNQNILLLDNLKKFCIVIK